MIELEHVCRSFEGKQALKDITLRIGNGITFLVGPSGAGKSTLASIIAGTDRDFTGTLRIDGQDIAARSESESYHALNTDIGFVWQNFHLVSSRTVAENVALPLELAGDVDKHSVTRALRAVGMERLADKRVRELSGGQRQRVAIARELAKNPAVIIADEPTSALDTENARSCMNALRTIAQERSVIVVTHDESLISPEDGLIRLSGGAVVEKRDPKHTGASRGRKARRDFNGLDITATIRLAKNSIRHGLLRCGAILACAAAVAAIAAPVLGGAVSKQADDALAGIYDSYGGSALDIGIIDSFTGGAGTDGEDTGPDVDVSQDTTGLLERYANDPRVEAVYAMQPYDEIEIKVEDKTYQPAPSGNAPALDHLVAGSLPNPKGNEVVIPLSAAKGLGLSPEEAVGKTVMFKATVTTWNGNEPVWKPVETQAVISGVADTTMKAPFEGEIYEFEIEDAFFFSPEATTEMRTQADLAGDPDFMLRPKSPDAMIEIKDELSAEGIVPLGNFELVENAVRLQEGTRGQSQTASATMLAAAGALSLAVFAGATWARRREGAILRICGCSRGDLAGSIAAEGAIIIAIAALLGAGVGSVACENILAGAGVSAATATCAYIVQTATSAFENPFSILKRARR
ncbi:MAG: ABC transporter ATP-binding protein [Slackia sp.]|nr:ABC transporter ATP-binding protein [Slackia sp.]